MLRIHCTSLRQGHLFPSLFLICLFHGQLTSLQGSDLKPVMCGCGKELALCPQVTSHCYSHLFSESLRFTLIPKMWLSQSCFKERASKKKSEWINYQYSVTGTVPSLLKQIEYSFLLFEGQVWLARDRRRRHRVGEFSFQQICTVCSVGDTGS